MISWYFLALTSAIFSALAAILEKKILFKNQVIGFTALLAIFNFIITIPFFFFIDYTAITSIGLAVLFLKSILAGTAFLCVMYGIKHLELSSALPLLVLTPGLVAITAFIFLRDIITKVEVLGLILLLIGTYVLQLKGNQKLLDPWKYFFKSKGYYFIILALILYTITSVLDKTLLNNFKVPLNAFIGFQHLFFAIIFLIILFSVKKTKDIKYSLKNTWILILVLAFITITYRYTQYSAVKIAPVALVLAMKRTAVFFAVIIGGKIFREHDLFRKSIATAIMILGAVLVIIG